MSGFRGVRAQQSADQGSLGHHLAPRVLEERSRINRIIIRKGIDGVGVGIGSVVDD